MVAVASGMSPYGPDGARSPSHALRRSFRRIHEHGGAVTADRYPDSHVFYRKLGHDYPRVVRGEGCWLVDERGKRYLDAVGGAFVANLGHSNPAIAEALAQQARQFGYLSGTASTHEPIQAPPADLAAPRPGDPDTRCSPP